jgi:hypothetical protein
VRREDAEIGLGGRLAIIALGVALMGGFRSDSLVGWIAGVVGVVLAVAAIGLVEVVMALWYRARRRLLARN